MCLLVDCFFVDQGFHVVEFLIKIMLLDSLLACLFVWLTGLYEYNRPWHNEGRNVIANRKRCEVHARNANSWYPDPFNVNSANSVYFVCVISPTPEKYLDQTWTLKRHGAKEFQCMRFLVCSMFSTSSVSLAEVLECLRRWIVSLSWFDLSLD